MKIPNRIVNDIYNTMHHMLINQSSIVVDFLEGEQLCDWQRTNEEFITHSLEIFRTFLKETEIEFDENIF